MKILYNFNTRINKDRFVKLSNELWDGNNISFRRHVFYLFPAFWYWLISLIGFLCVNTSVYFQFQAYPKIFYIYIATATFVYLIWSLALLIGYVRVLLWESPIATSLTQIKNLDNKFHFFIRLSIILFIIRVSMLSFSIFLEFYLSHPDRLLGFSAVYLHIFSCIIYLLWVYFVVHRVIVYSMSYCLVTPHTLEIVDQKWFLRRQNIVIQSKRLTLVSTTSEGLLQSIFRYGDIYFRTDGSTEWEEDMHIKYVPKPNFLKIELQRVFQKGSLE